VCDADLLPGWENALIGLKGERRRGTKEDETVLPVKEIDILLEDSRHGEGKKKKSWLGTCGQGSSISP